jgi:sarcosine oxidase subunit beta
MREVEIDADGPRPGLPKVATVLQNHPHGQILIGSSREFAGYDREVNRERIARMAGRAYRYVPDLARVRIIRTYAGLRPWTPDGRPLIGPTKQADGLIFATGHAGEGNTMALLTGRLVADLLTARETSADISPFSPDRFAMC